MAELYENDVYSTLAAAIGAGDLSLTVASATGFPSSGTFAVRVDDEIMTVSAVSGTTFTVSRATEAVAGVTAAAAHASGAEVHLVLTKRSLAAIAAAAGVTDHGALTGLTDDDHSDVYVSLDPATDTRNVIQPTDAAVKALVLKGAASQSDSHLEVQNSSGTALAKIDSTGAVILTPATMAGSLTSLAFKIAPQDTSDYFSFTNATGSAGRYLPTFFGETNSNYDTALYFIGRFPPAQDGSTTNSAIIFDGRTTSGALSQRPIVEFRNFAQLRWRIAPTGAVTQYVEDAVADAVTTCLTLGHNTSGTAAAGFGGGLVFRLESSTTADTTAGSITCSWGVATHASRTSKIVFSLYYTSTAQEILTLTANSTGVAQSTAVFTGRPSAPFGSGTNCERFGAGSGGTATTGNDNTVMGSGAGSALTSAQRTVAIGKDAGNTITTQQLNTLIGYDADVNSTSVAQAVAIGGQTVVANRGVAVGRGAQATADPSIAVGESAVASGVGAISIGASQTVSSSGGIGVGTSLTVSGTGSKVVMGSTLSVTHSDCFFFGEGATSDQAGELRFTNRNTGVTRLGATALSSTTADRKQFSLDGSWITSTDASRASSVALSVYYTSTAQEGIRITGDTGGVQLGFFGVTPVARPSAFTQTYSTATKTHAALTSATLTDNTAGTANTTVQALTDPADTPASADALRDDLVANLIPELRNNFADLVAQINALRVDLENAKQVINAMIDDDQSLGLKQ